MPSTQKLTASPRHPIIDWLRGLAILCMMAYHFSFDLNQFGFIHQAFNEASFWLIARLCIVTSFLSLVGISLVLAKNSTLSLKINANKRYWLRIIKLIICTVAVTFGSMLLFPQSYIFFGVLHCILIASLLCKPLINYPRLSFCLGVAIILLGVFYQHVWFNQAPLQWIGLMTFKPITEDYVPLFPWLGVVLIGMFLGNVIKQQAWFIASANREVRGLSAVLAWMGQRSLLIYMTHQPILMGFLWLYVQVASPH